MHLSAKKGERKRGFCLAGYAHYEQRGNEENEKSDGMAKAFLE
jgi:hypothetical protein